MCITHLYNQPHPAWINMIIKQLSVYEPRKLSGFFNKPADLCR